MITKYTITVDQFQGPPQPPMSTEELVEVIRLGLVSKRRQVGELIAQRLEGPGRYQEIEITGIGALAERWYWMSVASTLVDKS